MKRILPGIGLLGIASFGATPPLTINAQAQSDGEVVCMSGVAANGASRSYTFFTIAARAQWLVQRGFSVTSCHTARESLAEHKQSVCSLAEQAPARFKQMFAEAHRIELDELCALAEEANA